MKPGKLDLPTIWRGCDYATIVMRWKDLDGEPFNLTGWTARAQSLNVAFNVFVANAEAGVTGMNLTKAQTATLRLGKEPWDWIWENNGSRLPPILAGMVEIKDPTTP